jgi:hypothetical protein
MFAYAVDGPSDEAQFPPFGGGKIEDPLPLALDRRPAAVSACWRAMSGIGRIERARP